MSERFVRCNQRLWDEWAEVNFRSEFYDVAGFRKDPPPLAPEIREGLGDVAGKRVLHLQCHFGLDTLRIAGLGAEVTGIDFSAKAIGHARRLADELGIAARFIETDLYALPEVLDETFDVVFTSYGVLTWLPDMARWGQIVGRYLAPGARFFIAESHPAMLMLEAEGEDLRVTYPYFHDREPLVFPPKVGNYADPTAQLVETEYCWQHGFADIVMALLDAGLSLDELREYPTAPWKAFPFLVEDPPGSWRMPPDRPAVPLTFWLRASKR